MDEPNRDSVYTANMRAGKRRTYFFDVLQNKNNDYYISITESTKKPNKQGYNKHKIFLYKEDFVRFSNMLNDAIDHVKTELLPDYDYEQFARRQAKWEAQQNGNAAPTEPQADNLNMSADSEEDMSW